MYFLMFFFVFICCWNLLRFLLYSRILVIFVFEMFPWRPVIRSITRVWDLNLEIKCLICYALLLVPPEKNPLLIMLTIVNIASVIFNFVANWPDNTENTEKHSHIFYIFCHLHEIHTVLKQNIKIILPNTWN